MSASDGVRELGRWGAGALFGIGLHVGVAGALLPTDGETEIGGPSGAFVVELALVPVSRPDAPPDVPPGPDQVEAVDQSASEAAPEDEPAVAEPESQLVPLPDLPPLPPLPPAASDAELPSTESKKLVAHQVPQTPQVAAPATTATQAISEHVAERAAAPQIAPPSPIVSDAIPTWRSRLAMALERSKRYPAKAQARREEGIVQVRFVIDRQGRLVSHHVIRSSGHTLLDAEALALLERAQPFPPPPGEIKGQHVSLAVPIRFHLR